MSPPLRTRGSQLRFLPFLLLTVVMSRPLPGDAVGSGPDAHQDPFASRELRASIERLLNRLLANQSREVSNPGPGPAPVVRVFTPQLRQGSHGHLLLRIPLPWLTQDLPASHRLHRALLQPSRAVPEPWDITRPLLRELSLRGARGGALRLRLSAPVGEARTESPPFGSARLELQFQAAGARGRRSTHAHARDACPLGPGRCCRLHTVAASLQDLGWADWVLSPRQLQVAVCAGECPQLYRAANTHAQVRGRLHGLQPLRVPAPCCVPAAFAPVVLVQRTDSGVALRTYDDLMARSCHCA
uniref:growth/differentiation factor 15 n=1 Tax=Jaculus jaculus TaxID=51337 RepID=UPI001E1B1A72|nr:growth/differentiation factor 15 [Jaculus jaculus]